MHIALDDKVSEHLDGLVAKALGDEWAERTAKLLRRATEEVAISLSDFIGTELEDELKRHIQEAAQRAAEDFIERLRDGDENAVKQFLMLPHGYWKQRDERELGSLYWSRDIGPLALRRRLIEAVQDRLESEVILDQEAEIQALRESLKKAGVELHQWRCGEKVYTKT